MNPKTEIEPRIRLRRLLGLRSLGEVGGEVGSVVKIPMNHPATSEFEFKPNIGSASTRLFQKLIFRFQTSGAALLGLHADHEIHGRYGADERISGGDAGGEFPGGRARRDRGMGGG